MRKIFIAAFVAVLAACIGTAVASIPNGGTSFNVADPAVTVLGSGQTSTAEGISQKCDWSAESLTYCESPISFTPSATGVCEVNEDLALYGEETLNVAYGVGEKVAESDQRIDENGVTTTPNSKAEQTVSRSRLVPVEAGVTYSFKPWIRSYAGKGSAYWDLDYICYGA